MKCSVYKGETVTSLPWKSSTGLVALLLLVCDVSVASYSFFFFLLQIFYPFKANSLSSGWRVLPEEASEKAELPQKALSPLSRRFGLSEQIWSLQADERSDVTPAVQESQWVPQESSRGSWEFLCPVVITSLLPLLPAFLSLSCPLSSYIVKNSSRCS